jgi:hypothetical protein
MSVVDAGLYFYSERPVRAGRRDYVCTFCRGAIPRGVSHVCVSSGPRLGGGEVWSVRAHADCLALAQGREGVGGSLAFDGVAVNGSAAGASAAVLAGEGSGFPSPAGGGSVISSFSRV